MKVKMFFYESRSVREHSINFSDAKFRRDTTQNYSKPVEETPNRKYVMGFPVKLGLKSTCSPSQPCRCSSTLQKTKLCVCVDTHIKCRVCIAILSASGARCGPRRAALVDALCKKLSRQLKPSAEGARKAGTLWQWKKLMGSRMSAGRFPFQQSTRQSLRRTFAGALLQPLKRTLL